MMSTAKPAKVLLTACIAALVSSLGAGRAEAQWGMGGGGFGFFGGNLVPYVQQPGNFLNQVAISQMSHVKGPPGSNPYTGGLNPYGAPSNAYFNHVRDNGFVDQYSAYGRQPSYYRSATPARNRATPVAMTVAQTRPIVPLTSFYNPKEQLVWPGDAPMADSLKDKRAVFDQAARTVLDEVKKNGVASIATVTDARQKLLDYGRPGLKYVRTHETARIADGFHGFLLELYDSLAQAANPPVATAAAATPGSPSS